MRKYIAVWVGLVLFGINTFAEEFRIESFNSNGQLVFTEVAGATNYVVEQSSSLTGEWHPLTNMPPSGTGSITSSIPFPATAMFFHAIAQVESTEGMVLIPGGTNSGTDPDFGAYLLSVDSFYMDRTEVTKAQWDTVYNWAVAHGYSFENIGSGRASNHPVHTVNWYDCVKWCNARSQMEGKTACYNLSTWSCNFSANGYRLPTSDEWEYAARGGLRGKRFPWGDTINHNYANYKANGSAYSYDTSPYTSYTLHPSYDSGGTPYTSPVGSFSSNGYGLYDMSGNGWEWCNTASGSSRTFRGGCWNNYADFARCGYEYWRNPDLEYYLIGFRAVCR